MYTQGDPRAPPLMDLSRTSVEATDIMAMACYYSLETLDLSGCMHIGPQLGEALWAPQTHIFAGHVDVFGLVSCALPNLKGLSLARVKGVNNEQIIMVTEAIPGLTSLDVSDCFKIKEQVGSNLFSSKQFILWTAGYQSNGRPQRTWTRQHHMYSCDGILDPHCTFRCCCVCHAAAEYGLQNAQSCEKSF